MIPEIAVGIGNAAIAVAVDCGVGVTNPFAEFVGAGMGVATMVGEGIGLFAIGELSDIASSKRSRIMNASTSFHETPSVE